MLFTKSKARALEYIAQVGDLAVSHERKRAWDVKLDDHTTKAKYCRYTFVSAKSYEIKKAFDTPCIRDKSNIERNWLGKRAFLHSEDISKHPEERKADE